MIKFYGFCRDILNNQILGVFLRIKAMIQKEFIQMRRDKATLAMIIGLPLIQLIMFGFAINLNPKNLPTAIVGDANSEFARKILLGMQNSTYFKFLNPGVSEDEANFLLKTGKVQFVVNFPPNFSRSIVKHESPELLLEADATDPAATGRAVAVFNDLAQVVLSPDLVG